MNKVLIVAVHPDDETLGAGGTLLKHKANGDKIYWLIVTTIKNGYKNRDLSFDEETIKKREKEIELVDKMYKFNDIFRLEFPTMRLDEISMSELIQSISNIFNKVKPDIIYLPFKNDIHSDHRKVFEATYSCTKVFRYNFIKRILMMETLSETDFADITNSFIPNIFIDISEFFNKKLDIIGIYKSELGKYPFPRSREAIEALAKVRGVQANCRYAESFMLLKEIW